MKKLLYVLIVLALQPASTFAGDPAKARIITGNERLTQCISPVEINQVDGEERQLPAQGFELSPGAHSLQGSAKLNLTYCQAQSETTPTNVPPLEAVFEAGKTYYVGLDHSSSDRSQWKFVVWKVEDQEG